MSGVERIAAERERQIEELGYDPEHDNTHMAGDLAYAAACYAAPRPIYLVGTDLNVGGPDRLAGRVQWVEPWPGWDRTVLENPTTEERIRELEKAGALIAAEIDRLEAFG